MTELPRTERRNPKAAGLATMSTLDIVTLMNAEEATVTAAVRAALPDIARAADAIAAAFDRGGRLRYVGAGTSGRLGVLDASEAPPTFGVEPDLVHGVIAGGDGALRTSLEGAEDDPLAGEREIVRVARPGDVVVGLSASGSARYVVAAIQAARALGAITAGVTCVPGSPLADAVELPIVVDVGPEILAGSSRLKAGSATKLVLNMLSTAAMIRSGRTKGDLMVDLKPTNAKLRSRAIRMVRDELGIDEDAARTRLEASGWSVRRAIDAR
ncbi:MAG TPA: N-acetylmuramic acid 6-phosphate etherase [Candidatus Limnocylindria bacterium]|nr:N-acetylmuramic acid 6-phosphate etherase [Candidatus Limnocylindria bacterium]